jgi:hypothetical protein
MTHEVPSNGQRLILAEIEETLESLLQRFQLAFSTLRMSVEFQGTVHLSDDVMVNGDAFSRDIWLDGEGKRCTERERCRTDVFLLERVTHRKQSVALRRHIPRRSDR